MFSTTTIFLQTYNYDFITQLLMLNLVLFLIGAWGFFFHSNHFIFLIICHELMLFSLILQLVLIGYLFDDLIPQIFALFLLLLSSAEVVVVFSIIIRYYKLTEVVLIYPVYYINSPQPKKKK